MMLPAGQTMGLPPLCNVLVPSQRCVAYLNPQILLAIVLLFLFLYFVFALILCICTCICICMVLYLWFYFVSAMYLCPAKGASHTWPNKIIGHCLALFVIVFCICAYSLYLYLHLYLYGIHDFILSPQCTCAPPRVRRIPDPTTIIGHCLAFLLCICAYSLYLYLHLYLYGIVFVILFCLCNVLVLRQGCVAYLTPQTYWSLSCSFRFYSVFVFFFVFALVFEFLFVICIRNVLVPCQGCVAYLTPQSYWPLSWYFVTVFCILFMFCICICICDLYLQCTASHTWPYKLIGHCLHQVKHYHLEVTRIDQQKILKQQQQQYFKTTTTTTNDQQKIRMIVSHPAAEMFQVVGPSLGASVLGWEDKLVASIAPDLKQKLGLKLRPLRCFPPRGLQKGVSKLS